MIATVFDPMDPLDLCILLDPALESVVEECEATFTSEVEGFDRVTLDDIDVHQGVFDADFDYTEGYPPGEDFSDAADLASDPVADDAEDYEEAELDLLSGGFGDPIEAIDDFEFGG